MRKICMLIIGMALAVPVALAQSAAEKAMNSLWQDFRAKYPNPYQSIGYAGFEDHSRLYLIAEPGPDISLQDIEEVFAGFDYKITEKKWKIGYDGWVKDILVVLNFAPAYYKYELIAELNRLIFSTAERPVWMELLVKQEREVFVQGENLNYNITVSDLNQWFISDNALFTAYPDTHRIVTVPEILQQAETGVFYSREPGFVLWCLSGTGQNDRMKQQFRIFAVDTDQILGSVSNNSTLVIIGRKRRVPFAAMPPLRTEVIGTLLSAKNGYLYQSLNIGELLTGKMSDGKDWVPATLSEELENNELGHLMTLTDIAMKDWLRKGEMRYDDYRYVKPPYYPACMNGFDTIQTVRFNWNTLGLINMKDFGRYRIYVRNNTGALHISLFDHTDPNAETGLSAHLEEMANQYFANLNNSDVARVAQYIFLYQLFQLHDISYSYAIPPSKDKSDLLVKDARSVLTRLKELTDKEISRFTGDVARFGYFQLDRPYRIGKRWERWELEYAGSTGKEREKARLKMAEYLEEWFKEEDASLIADIEREQALSGVIKELRNEISGQDPSGFDKLCRVISYPHGNYYMADSLIFKKANHINRLVRKIQKYNEFLGIDLEKIKDNYVMNLQDDSSRWFKTPKVVITANTFRNYDTTYATDKYNLLSGPTGGHSVKGDNSEVRRVTAAEKPQVKEQVFTKTGKTRGLAGIEAFQHAEVTYEYKHADKKKEAERRKLPALDAALLWSNDAVTSSSKDEAYYNMVQTNLAMSQDVGKMNFKSYYSNELDKIDRAVKSQLDKHRREANWTNTVEGNKTKFQDSFAEMDSFFRQKMKNAPDERIYNELVNDYSEFNRMKERIHNTHIRMKSVSKEARQTLSTQERMSIGVANFATGIAAKYKEECPDCETMVRNANKLAADIMMQRSQAYQESKNEENKFLKL